MRLYHAENDCCGGYDIIATEGTFAMTCVSGECGGYDVNPRSLPEFEEVARVEDLGEQFWRPLYWHEDQVTGQWERLERVAEPLLAVFDPLLEYKLPVWLR